MQLKRLFVSLAFWAALVPAVAQIRKIDPTLLGKATAGDAQSQFLVGEAYAQGKGVAQDATQAAAWFQKAAEQGLAQAQFQLGVFFHTGQGVAQSDTDAAAWYLKAATQGLAEAQLNLGLLYDHGEGVPQNDALAADWYRTGRPARKRSRSAVHPT